jgi:hypothetical protein
MTIFLYYHRHVAGVLIEYRSKFSLSDFPFEEAEQVVVGLDVGGPYCVNVVVTKKYDYFALCNAERPPSEPLEYG